MIGARIASAAVGLALLAGCGGGGMFGRAAVNPLAGRILDVASGTYVGERQLVARLAAQDMVLLGESPGRPDQARVAARLVRTLAGAEGGRLTSVGFESLSTDAQPLIVEYLRSHPTDGHGLEGALGQETSDRPHLAQFAPALNAAVDANLQIVAADLPLDGVRAVLARGLRALPPEFVTRTGLAEPFATPVEQSLRDELAVAACARATSRAVDALVAARRARDATMADRLAAVTGRGQSVLLAPPGHVRNDRGVPWYLRRLRPAARVVSLAFVELEPAATVPADLPYDFVWFTAAPAPAPGAARANPCVGGAPPPPDNAVPRGLPRPEIPEDTEAGVRRPSGGGRAIVAALGPAPS